MRGFLLCPAVSLIYQTHHPGLPLIPRKYNYFNLNVPLTKILGFTIFWNKWTGLPTFKLQLVYFIVYKLISWSGKPRLIFRVKPRQSWVKLLALPRNVILGWWGLSVANTSKFVRFFSDEENKFFNNDTKGRYYKTFNGHNLRIFVKS